MTIRLDNLSDRENEEIRIREKRRYEPRICSFYGSRGVLATRDVDEFRIDQEGSDENQIIIWVKSLDNLVDMFDHDHARKILRHFLS